MKIVLLLSTLFPAGLLAAFLGSNAVQEEASDVTEATTRNIQVIQSDDQPAQVITLRGQAIEPQEAAVDAPPATARRVHVVQAGEPAAIYSFQGEARSRVQAAPGMTTVRSIQTAPLTGTWAVQAEGLPGAGISSPHPMTAFAYSVGSGEAAEKTQEALAKLKAAKSDDDKAEAREELQAALGDEFDEFLKHQSDELERMEKKLSNLRDQLDKRRDAKDEVISLRVKTIENEVNGLGWPTGGGVNLFSPGGNAFGRTFESNLSFTAPAAVATPFLSPTPAAAPAIAAPEQPTEDAETEKEPPSKPRSRRALGKLAEKLESALPIQSPVVGRKAPPAFFIVARRSSSHDIDSTGEFHGRLEEGDAERRATMVERLHIQVLDFQRVLLDKLATRLDFVAHQDPKHFVGGAGVGHVDPQ